MNFTNVIKSSLFDMGIQIRYLSAKRRSKLLGLDRLHRSDTFMCSYPRSGNTLTRTIIACLLDPSIKAVELKTVEELVPDAGQLPLRSVPIRIFKQHRADFDLFPRVIYNVRDGRDAICSAYKYACDVFDFQGTLLDFLPDRNAQIFGFWHDHVESAIRYQKAYPDRFLLVRFEDLKCNPHKVINRLATFIGCPTSIERVNEIITITKISNVTIDQSVQSDPRYRFTLGTGQIGRWNQTMSETELKIFESMSSSSMLKLGYDLAHPTIQRNLSHFEQSDNIPR